ncbi:MAG: putative bacteriocin export ABC transporter [Bacillota bacterium]|nr:putative bacteriocin export ABC transporter [Bacillota bacterium]
MVVAKLENIDKAFGDKKIFKNFNLEISEGRLYGRVGPSGSGKSTLLNMIGLLEKPDSGDVELFGRKNIRLNSRVAMLMHRNKISYLFQNYALSDNDTVYYNLKIALKYSTVKNKEQEIKKALALVGLEGFEKNKIFTLSGGEQQRVAMARVLLKPSQLILADEPTGNLDNDNTKEILKLFKLLLKEYKKTVVIVTHDERIAKECDDIIRL